MEKERNREKYEMHTVWYEIIWERCRHARTEADIEVHGLAHAGYSCKTQWQNSKTASGFFPHSETQWIIGEREQRGQGGKGRVSMGCPFVLVYFSFVLVDPRCQHLYTLTGDVRVSRGGPQIPPLLRWVFSRWFLSKSHGSQRYQNNTKHSHLDDSCTDQIFGLNELQ